MPRSVVSSGERFEEVLDLLNCFDRWVICGGFAGEPAADRIDAPCATSRIARQAASSATSSFPLPRGSGRDG